MGQLVNSAGTDAHQTFAMVDLESGINTPMIVKPTGTVIGLDLLAGSQRSASAINAGVYLVATGAACHFNFGNNAVTATTSDGMLMPGERVLVLPNEYIAFIKAAGQPDSIVRLTYCE